MKRLLCILALAALPLLGANPKPLQAIASPATHSVKLTWVASADASSTNAVSYNVSRASGACASGQTFTSLGTTGVSALTYTDTSIAGGQDYCYQVAAEGSNGAVSVNNPTVTAAVPPFPATGLAAAAQ